MNIYICLIPHIAFKSENYNRFFDVGFGWKADPYKDLHGDFGSTGICRNYHKGSPQNIYYKYLQGEKVYFVYYCNKRSGDYFDTKRKGLNNPDSVYITGILKIENSYENHKKAKEAGLNYGNILSKNGYINGKQKFYDKNEFRNPYLIGKALDKKNYLLTLDPYDQIQ